MYKIQCNKVFKGEGHKKAYVANHPKPSEAVEYTQHEDQAHTFNDMAACKVIRDEVLYVADSVTILKV